MLYLEVCMYTMCMPGTLDSHEWALDPQELELTRIVCLKWVLEIELESSARVLLSLKH